MEADELIRRRFLSAFEQTVGAELPRGWAEPKPQRGKLRQSAAVLAQVAEQPDREAMGKLLEDIAKRVAAHEGSRRQGDTSAGDKTGEAALWRNLGALVNRVGETRSGEPVNLFTLELCAGQVWAASLAHLAREVGGKIPAATEATLTALARILLRTTARRWSDDDRRREKGAGG